MSKVGRPTKYESKFCDQIIEMARYGASKAEMALDLGIVMSTFTKWQEENEEFSAAVKEAEQISQGWWEKQGRVATFGGVDGFNATSFIFNMKNRFHRDWKDKRENEITGKDGGPVALDLTAKALAVMTDEQLQALADAESQDNNG